MFCEQTYYYYFKNMHLIWFKFERAVRDLKSISAPRDVARVAIADVVQPTFTQPARAHLQVDPNIITFFLLKKVVFFYQYLFF